MPVVAAHLPQVGHGQSGEPDQRSGGQVDEDERGVVDLTHVDGVLCTRRIELRTPHLVDQFAGHEGAALHRLVVFGQWLRAARERAGDT